MLGSEQDARRNSTVPPVTSSDKALLEQIYQRRLSKQEAAEAYPEFEQLRKRDQKQVMKQLSKHQSATVSNRLSPDINRANILQNVR
jgi:hypothetical protein